MLGVSWLVESSSRCVDESRMASQGTHGTEIEYLSVIFGKFTDGSECLGRDRR